MKTMKLIEVKNRVENIAERIQTICLVLDNLEHLEAVSDGVAIYSEHPDVRSDLVQLCVSELLSAADKLNTLTEDCTQYDVEKAVEVHEET